MSPLINNSFHFKSHINMKQILHNCGVITTSHHLTSYLIVQGSCAAVDEHLLPEHKQCTAITHKTNMRVTLDRTLLRIEQFTVKIPEVTAWTRLLSSKTSETDNTKSRDSIFYIT